MRVRSLIFLLLLIAGNTNGQIIDSLEKMLHQAVTQSGGGQGMVLEPTLAESLSALSGAGAPTIPAGAGASPSASRQWPADALELLRRAEPLAVDSTLAIQNW